VFNGQKWLGSGETHESVSPHDNSVNAKVTHGTVADYESCIENMQKNWKSWASMPAPARGDIVRQIGEALRLERKNLGSILALEMGKVQAEGEGEV